MATSAPRWSPPTTEEMLSEGRQLAKIHNNIVVKVPPLRATASMRLRSLTAENIKINVTLCFRGTGPSGRQIGGIHLAPSSAAWDIPGRHGGGPQIPEIYQNYEFQTQVLAASLRCPPHVIDSAKAGAHIGTMPFKVLDMLFNHPLTDTGLDQFLKDYNKVFAETPAAR